MPRYIREYAELFKPRPWTPPLAGHAAVVRTPDDPGRHGRRLDGMEKPQRQRPGGRQPRGSLAKATDRALHNTTRGGRSRPSPRRSTTILNCAPSGTCWSASTAWAKPWPASYWPSCRGPRSCARAQRWRPMPGLNPRQHQFRNLDQPAGADLAASAMRCCEPPCTCRPCPRCGTIRPSRLWS